MGLWGLACCDDAWWAMVVEGILNPKTNISHSQCPRAGLGRESLSNGEHADGEPLDF